MHQLIFAIVFTHSTTANLDAIGTIAAWITELCFHDLWMLVPQNHVNLFCRRIFAKNLCNGSTPEPAQVLFFIPFVSSCRARIAGDRDLGERSKRPIGAR